MRALLLVIILIISYISFPNIIPSVYAGSDTDPVDFIQCGKEYEDFGGTAKMCEAGANSFNGGKITDSKGNLLPNARARIYYKNTSGIPLTSGLSEDSYLDIQVTKEGYKYCAFSTTQNDFPAAYKIGLLADGTEEKTWELDTQDACMTTEGPVGGISNLKKATQQFGCMVSNGAPACTDLSKKPPGERKGQVFTTSSSCATECGKWQLYYSQTLDEYRCINILSEEPSRGYSRVDSTDHYLRVDCDNSRNGQLNKKVPDSPTPIRESPTPTYRPPKPPCAEGLEEGTGDERRTTVCNSVRTGLGVNFDTSAAGFVSFLFTFLLSLSGSILLLVIIYSGYQMMTSRGDQEKIKVARERITSAVVGFLFLVFSLVILEVIGVDILRIPGFCGDNTANCPNISQPSPTPFPTLEPRTVPVIDKPNGPN